MLQYRKRLPVEINKCYPRKSEITLADRRAFMKTDCGLYVFVTPDGKLKRDLAAVSGKVSLDATTIEDEIITFSELDFGPYAMVVDLILTSVAFIPHEGHIEDVDMNVFQFILDTTTDLVTTLEQENEDPLHGTLTRTMIEDRIPADDGSGLYVYETSEEIVSILTEVMDIQFEVNQVLSDLRQGIPIDFENKYDYLRMQELTQVFEPGNGLASRYYFRSIADYYYFLLVHFIASKPNVALCECCGRYFIPQTRRKTLYCDREFKNGKTCKELAPALKHKLDAKRKKVIEEFDRAKRRMYKRYERTENFGEKLSNKNLSYNEYYEWLKRATDARDRYLAGKLSEEDALEIIDVK